MKIEKAMEELSKLKHYVDCQPSEFNENTWDAIEEAETALQEKQERDKGCEWCRERKPILDEIGNLQIDDIDSSLWFTCQADADDIYEEHTDIKFCPMCGRKLGENDGD